MNATLYLVGQADAALANGLRAASFRIDPTADCAAAQVLVSVLQTADHAIAAAHAFAAASIDGAGERLALHIWRLPNCDDWQACRDAATMAAFTRHAALAWAGRRLRVNGLTVEAGSPPGPDAGIVDLAAAIHAVWRWRSMTGQVFHLGTAMARNASLPQGFSA